MHLKTYLCKKVGLYLSDLYSKNIKNNYYT